MLFTTTIKQRYYLEQDANDRQDKKTPKKPKDQVRFIFFRSHVRIWMGSEEEIKVITFT